MLAVRFGVLVVIAGAAGLPTQASDWDRQLSRLKERRCIPDDVVTLGNPLCQGQDDLTQRLQCIASNVGISSDQGYDPAAGDNYADGLSRDAEWNIQQKERLANCSSMIMEQVPAEREGAFMLACWHQLLFSDCNRRKMTTLVEEVDPENAKELVDAIADLAEGPCFDEGLKYAETLGTKWNNCAVKNELNMKILVGAAHYYNIFSQGQNVPDPSVERNIAAREQFDRMKTTAHCYAVSTGEVTENGDINYDLINNATRGAVGREQLKLVDRAFVDYCQNQNPANIGEFYDCFNKEKPFACAVLKSYDIALGRSATSGTSGVVVPTVAPTAAGIIVGLLGRLF